MSTQTHVSNPANVHAHASGHAHAKKTSDIQRSAFFFCVTTQLTRYMRVTRQLLICYRRSNRGRRENCLYRREENCDVFFHRAAAICDHAAPMTKDPNAEYASFLVKRIPESRSLTQPA